jgi:hypothetical protein
MLKLFKTLVSNLLLTWSGSPLFGNFVTIEIGDIQADMKRLNELLEKTRSDARDAAIAAEQKLVLQRNELAGDHKRQLQLAERDAKLAVERDVALAMADYNKQLENVRKNGNSEREIAVFKQEIKHLEAQLAAATARAQPQSGDSSSSGSGSSNINVGKDALTIKIRHELKHRRSEVNIMTREVNKFRTVLWVLFTVFTIFIVTSDALHPLRTLARYGN